MPCPNTADRLTQEATSLAAGGSNATTYQWDANGNLAARLEEGRATLYRFDPHNRLIDIRSGATQTQAQAATPSVSYAYDASGNRVKKSLKSAATPQKDYASSYLIDSNHSYPQVALETRVSTCGTAPQTESTAYVWGSSLIRQTRAGAGTLYASPSAGDDIFPLAGHLGTSLGAVGMGIRCTRLTLVASSAWES